MTPVAGAGLIRVLGVQDHEFIHTHSVLSVWATSGPAERSDDLHPPLGGPRERCPVLSADRRRPVRFVEEHRAGWFQFLRTRLRHRVTGA